MPTSANPNLLEVDWSSLPAPTDDGATSGLVGKELPDVSLAATDGTHVSLGKLVGRIVVFAYPRTGEPDKPALVEDWDLIPGARGCTPQSCGFRDLHGQLTGAGAARVFGLSTQETAYQREVVERLELPFPMLSDAALALSGALPLPTMLVAGQTLLKRLALVLDCGRITKIFYPVFPPDRNADDVLAWLRAHPASADALR